MAASSSPQIRCANFYGRGGSPQSSRNRLNSVQPRRTEQWHYRAASATVNPAESANGAEAGKTRLRPIELGDAVLTPGGFVDFETVFRTTNTESNIATNFAAIPFSNTPQGRGYRIPLYGAISRLNLKNSKTNIRGHDHHRLRRGRFQWK